MYDDLGNGNSPQPTFLECFLSRSMIKCYNVPPLPLTDRVIGLEYHLKAFFSANTLPLLLFCAFDALRVILSFTFTQTTHTHTIVYSFAHTTNVSVWTLSCVAWPVTSVGGWENEPTLHEMSAFLYSSGGWPKELSTQNKNTWSCKYTVGLPVDRAQKLHACYAHNIEKQ